MTETAQNPDIFAITKFLDLHYVNYEVKDYVIWAEMEYLDPKTGQVFAEWSIITKKNVREFLGY